MQNDEFVNRAGFAYLRKIRDLFPFGVIIVVDSVSNRDGTDTLYNIENIQFSDQTGTPTPTNTPMPTDTASTPP